MKTGTEPCTGCGGAGRDVLGDTCERCRGHGYWPAPCIECGELTEGETCSLLCTLVRADREGYAP